MGSKVYRYWKMARLCAVTCIHFNMFQCQNFFYLFLVNNGSSTCQLFFFYFKILFDWLIDFCKLKLLSKCLNCNHDKFAIFLDDSSFVTHILTQETRSRAVSCNVISKIKNRSRAIEPPHISLYRVSIKQNE